MGEITKIHLTTPALDSIKNPNTLTKPDAVRNWVDNLPYANPPRMAQETLTSLKLLNRHPDKVSQRASIMGIYLELFRKIMEMARKIICQHNDNRAPNKNNQELIAIAEEISSEMAYGFKHVLNSELGSANKISPSKCAENIQNAISCLAYGLILNMTAYRPESHTARREVFQLLAIAQQLGVANQEIMNAKAETEREVSVLSSFKCILLLSILNPSRLTPREIWGAYDYLSWHAKNARITSVEQASQYSGNYLIALDGIKKPSLFTPENLPQTPGKHMILETRGLNIVISRHLDILSEDNAALIRGSENINHGIKIHLLRQMLHIWHTNPKRRSERKEKFDRLACAFGVGPAYSFLKEGTIKNQQQVELEAGDETIDTIDEVASTHTIYECRQENISSGGMMIISSDQTIEKLKIGQIMVSESLISEETKQPKIGVVRRITNKDQHTTEFGVQFIPGKLLAATALPEIFGRKHAADIQPCIVLELGENKPKALITPNMVYQPDRHYVLDTYQGTTNRVIAGKSLESTACFDCFEYNVLEHC